MNVSAEALIAASLESADAASDAARRIYRANTRAPRNQPRSSNPGTPGPVATSRSRSCGFKPARLAGGFKRRMLNKRETTAVVSRLFSILRLNPPASLAGLNPQDLDLLVATGPGVPGFELLGWFLGALVFARYILRAASLAASADSREAAINASALTFIRVYVGLMFVPHFGSHVLGGPDQFKIYVLYFESLGLHMPAIQVVLAGGIELICAIGLTLGLFTRPVALLGSVYLLMSMLWGGHFQIGYVWALPEGGYEFGVVWAAMIAVFAVVGGGPHSVDRIARQSDFQNRWPWLRPARLLFL